MSLRVTQQTIARNTLAGLQANLSRLQQLQNELASGRRVNKPSDDPVQTVTAMQLRADLQRTQQLGRNIDDALARLSSADSALTEANKLVTRVRQLVVSGLNDTNGTDERAAMADEIDTLRAGLIGVANSQYVGTPLFAGTVDSTRLGTPTATPLAFDPTTGAYLGNGAAVRRTVAAGDRVQVNVTGDQAFTDLLADGSGGGVLASISADLRSGDTAALTTDLGRLDTATDAMSAAQSLIGARTNRVQSMQTTANDHLDSAKAGLSDAESVDLPKTIMELQLQSTAYQAALGATARVVQPSLLDFLR